MVRSQFYEIPPCFTLPWDKYSCPKWRNRHEFLPVTIVRVAVLKCVGLLKSLQIPPGAFRRSPAAATSET
jgi:hypothetical protein